VYLLGTGAVCSLGQSADALANAFLAPPPAPHRLDLPELGLELPYRKILSSDFNEADRLMDSIDTAVRQAIATSGLDSGDLAETVLLLGTSSADLGELETAYAQDRAAGHDLPMRHSGFGKFAARIAQRFGIRGGEFTFNTACTSSANALLYAARFLERGRARFVLVLGVEGFNRFTVAGFHGLMLLSPTHIRPFDKERDGSVLGEGVAAAVLGGARPSRASAFRLLAGSNACDAQGITASSPEVMAAVMRQCAERAGVPLTSIDAIKAHGTGTPANDTAERDALRAVFDDEVPDFTALKPHLGHTLGAGGVLELVAMTACLCAGFVPPTADFSLPDAPHEPQPLTTAKPFVQGNVMLNYFGFGGNNTSLMISNFDHGPA
jgi:3-oxoacyl-(acyl-carrier-protein) synthase